MTSRRHGAAGIVHANAFMIFGGYEYGESGKLRSTEIISEEGQVSPGPEMPLPVYRHAIAYVNGTTSILTGGSTNANVHSPLTWYSNHVSQEFQPGPPLITGRYGHASATIQDQQNKEDIVAVVGGYNNKNGGYLDSTELLINREWIQGKIILNHKMSFFVVFLYVAAFFLN